MDFDFQQFYDMAEILLKVVLNPIQSINQSNIIVLVTDSFISVISACLFSFLLWETCSHNNNKNRKRNSKQYWKRTKWSRHGRHRMVVGFTTTYAISAYIDHDQRCVFESRSWRCVLETILWDKDCL